MRLNGWQGVTRTKKVRTIVLDAAASRAPDLVVAHFTYVPMLTGNFAYTAFVGDASDNALVETIIGLYKTDCIRTRSPFRTGPLRRLSDLEETTAARVHWYNTSRLMHRLGRIPPIEYEDSYKAKHRDGQPANQTRDRPECAPNPDQTRVCTKPGTIHCSGDARRGLSTDVFQRP